MGAFLHRLKLACYGIGFMLLGDPVRSIDIILQNRGNDRSDAARSLHYVFSFWSRDGRDGFRDMSIMKEPRKLNAANPKNGSA